jgi:SPP1 family predicted phage head-tail adaptor
MKIGAMDRRVVIQKRTLLQSASGEYTEVFTDAATVWAEVKELRGGEFFAARQENAEITTRFYIRWRADVTVLDRIVYDGKFYDIAQVSEMGRRSGLDILATAVTP